MSILDTTQEYLLSEIFSLNQKITSLKIDNAFLREELRLATRDEEEIFCEDYSQPLSNN